MTWNWYSTLGFVALAIVALGISVYLALHLLLPLLTVTLAGLTRVARRVRRRPPPSAT